MPIKLPTFEEITSGEYDKQHRTQFKAPQSSPSASRDRKNSDESKQYANADEIQRMYTDARNIWKQESEWNKDNLTAIQHAPHTGNYIIIDKRNGKLTVFDKDNNEIYSSDIVTGLSGDDYNTITYTGIGSGIKNHAGNNSTPAGITQITGISTYHNAPAFIRARYNQNTGKWDDSIASSLHFGNVSGNKHRSNGCVRLNPEALTTLRKLIGEGTFVYTLPERDGSRFKISQGQLNYVADNPYGNEDQDNPQRHWDDYNVYIDKNYQPVSLKFKSGDKELDKNVEQYLNSISENKERLMKEFGVSSEQYNRIALLAAGIAKQESDYGTGKKYALKKVVPDWAISTLKRLRGDSEAASKNLSKGWTQIKINGDNADMRNLYKKYKINEDSLDSGDTAALATMLRLLQTYNSEVRGRTFAGASQTEISPYDALLYKWNGRNYELKNHTATPDKNGYIKGVKDFIDKISIYI